MDWVGRRFGRYEVIREIARGGQGVVVEACVDGWPKRFARGFVRRRLGDESGTLEDFDRAIELEPPGQNLNAWMLARAVLRHKQGDLEGALADAEYLLGKLPPADARFPRVEALVKQLRDRLGR